jgi:hypothetical protein
VERRSRKTVSVGEALASHPVWELWKTMDEGPEKYRAYLCSREWNQRKERVKARSGGVCERCRVNGGENVHHLTYARKYNEPLDDLLHLCRGCHEFISGVSDVDPKPRRKLYLAGKVSKNCWRHSIVKNLRSADWDNSPLPSAVVVGGEQFDYVGPFFVSCDHGCYHGDGTHGCLGINELTEIDGEVVETDWTSDCREWLGDRGLVDNHGCRIGCGSDFIANKCLAGIDAADVVMAWIDTPDCFGTIAEIGFAVGKYTEVWVAFSDFALYQDMWFLGTIAKKAGVYASPTEAITKFQVEKTHA